LTRARCASPVGQPCLAHQDVSFVRSAVFKEQVAVCSSPFHRPRLSSVPQGDFINIPQIQGYLQLVFFDHVLSFPTITTTSLPMQRLSAHRSAPHPPWNPCRKQRLTQLPALRTGRHWLFPVQRRKIIYHRSNMKSIAKTAICPFSHTMSVHKRRHQAMICCPPP